MARRANNQPGSAPGSETQGKRVVFDRETWQALDLLARDRMMTFQEVADEAFRDLLDKHGRPTDVLDALRKSARFAKANDDRPAAASEEQPTPPPRGTRASASRRPKRRPGKKEPAGSRRARSKA